ncbi:FAD-binding protein [Microdochium nivale]|nr:FAD-binding protein [Microdochium nivale]
MVRIQGFQGMQYLRDGTADEQRDYAFFNEQYATSSHGKEHNMHPSAIIRPKDDEDVIRVIRWAADNNVAVAIKTGGHQYSGASSTSGSNIQLDLCNTYEDLMVIDPHSSSNNTTITTLDEGRTLVYAGVSNKLKDFNEYLTHNGLFVPHGMCASVCIGGHGQTGGVGQLGRGFGLFGDHIRAIRIIGFDGEVRNITKASDPEMFFAICGGSPGNFGVITHYTLEVHKAAHYMGRVEGPNGFKGPHGIKALWIYSEPILRQLLTYVVEMADSDDVPRGFDLCVSVMSTAFPISHIFPSLRDADILEKVKNKIQQHFADDFMTWLNGSFPANIILYASWCPTSPEDVYDETVDAWFERFRDLKGCFGTQSLVFEEVDEDMAHMSGRWIMDQEREFELPYVKRAYTTASTTLGRDNFVDSAVERIDLIYNEKHLLDRDDDLDQYLCNKLVAQFQPYGGRHSQFYRNRDNGTSYAWRDMTLTLVLDCFHDDNAQAKALADEWQAKNDEIMTGPEGTFSRDAERRTLWGSYGDWDLSDEKVWSKYYGSREVYERIGRARGRADPNGTFTPNPFSVTRIL